MPYAIEPKRERSGLRPFFQSKHLSKLRLLSGLLTLDDDSLSELAANQIRLSETGRLITMTVSKFEQSTCLIEYRALASNLLRRLPTFHAAYFSMRAHDAPTLTSISGGGENAKSVIHSRRISISFGTSFGAHSNISES